MKDSVKKALERPLTKEEQAAVDRDVQAIISALKSTEGKPRRYPFGGFGIGRVMAESASKHKEPHP